MWPQGPSSRPQVSLSFLIHLLSHPIPTILGPTEQTSNDRYKTSACLPLSLKHPVPVPSLESAGLGALLPALPMDVYTEVNPAVLLPGEDARPRAYSPPPRKDAFTAK